MIVAGLGRAVQGADKAVAAAADSLILADDVDFVFGAVRFFVQVYIKGVCVMREEKKEEDASEHGRTHDERLDSYVVWNQCYGEVVSVQEMGST